MAEIPSPQPRPQALMRYRVPEGGLEPNAIARISSGDVTIDISPRTTGNEAA